MYKVNEIFYSLQGEGYWTGTPMVFLRLSGCNLKCPFCDTAHDSGTSMSARDIVDEIRKADEGSSRRVCITGGEPLLQLDRALVKAIGDNGYRIHLETNGTRPLPCDIDWVTVSPKKGARVVIYPDDINEVKIIFEGDDSPLLLQWEDEGLKYIQPCDTGDPVKNKENTALAVEYVKRHPGWRLSLQTHKLIDIR